MTQRMSPALAKQSIWSQGNEPTALAPAVMTHAMMLLPGLWPSLAPCPAGSAPKPIRRRERLRYGPNGPQCKPARQPEPTGSAKNPRGRRPRTATAGRFSPNDLGAGQSRGALPPHGGSDGPLPPCLGCPLTSGSTP